MKYFLGLFVLIALVVALVLCQGSVPDVRDPVVRVFGGAGEVSGSLSIVDLGQTQIMVDCGAYYPHGSGTAEKRAERASKKNNIIPELASQCQYLIWTHAHLDHIGRTPLLVRKGFQGSILTTQGTATLASVMLDMQVRYDANRVRNWAWSTFGFRKRAPRVVIKPHWHPSCRYAQKISQRNLATRTSSLKELRGYLANLDGRKVVVSPCRMCSQMEVDAILSLVRTFPFERDIQLDSNTTLRFLRAGHIPGSASALIESVVEGPAKRILFSGDLGNEISLLAPGPSPAPEADAVFVEATYGNFTRDPDTIDQHEVFRSDVAETLRGGGVAWIPAFALDRTQKILYELTLAQEEGLISGQIPIFIPSPSAANITSLYQTNQTEGWFNDAVERNRNAFRPLGLKERLPKGPLKGPAIVISTSGMMDTAYSARIAPVLQDPSTTVFLVGYQDPGTPGGKLRSGSRSVFVGGKKFEVAADVKTYGCFSGHGDASEIDHWLSKQSTGTTVVLVHGEGSDLAERANGLMSLFNVVIAQPGEAISVE